MSETVTTEEKIKENLRAYINLYHALAGIAEQLAANMPGGTRVNERIETHFNKVLGAPIESGDDKERSFWVEYHRIDCLPDPHCLDICILRKHWGRTAYTHIKDRMSLYFSTLPNLKAELKASPAECMRKAREYANQLPLVDGAKAELDAIHQARDAYRAKYGPVIRQFYDVARY